MKMGSGEKQMVKLREHIVRKSCWESLFLFSVFVNILECLMSVKEGGRILIFIEGK